MSLKKVVSVIVTYNSFIGESEAYKTLNTHDIFVIDNSNVEAIKIQNMDFCEKNEIKIKQWNENVGLCKAYNYAFDELKDLYENIILSDDDTIYEEGYINKMLKCMTEDIDVVVPMVFDFYSDTRKLPREVDTVALLTYHKIFGGRHFQIYDTPGKIVSNRKYFLSINTGTLINRNLFQNYRHNEKAILGANDSLFFNTIDRNRIYLSDALLYQKESKFDDDFSTALSRQSLILVEGYSTWGKLWYILGFNDMVFRTLRFKSLKFFFNYIKLLPKIHSIGKYDPLQENGC